MKRFYLLPQVEIELRRIPKHLRTNYSQMNFYLGFPVVLACAMDIDEVNHEIIAGDPEAYCFPADLNVLMDQANLDRCKTYCEVHRIPGDDLLRGYTWRYAIGMIARLAQFCQKLEGMGAEIFPSGIDLKTKWPDLPVALQDKVKTALEFLIAERARDHAPPIFQERILYRHILRLGISSFRGPVYFGGEEF